VPIDTDMSPSVYVTDASRLVAAAPLLRTYRKESVDPTFDPADVNEVALRRTLSGPESDSNDGETDELRPERRLATPPPPSDNFQTYAVEIPRVSATDSSFVLRRRYETRELHLLPSSTWRS